MSKKKNKKNKSGRDKKAASAHTFSIRMEGAGAQSLLTFCSVDAILRAM